MMLSPEGYAQLYLENESVKKIKTQICALKKEITHCKKVIERYWEYPEEAHILPSCDTKIIMCEMYLDEAKQALKKAGGEYVPSKSEQKQMKLKEKLCGIRRFSYCVGDFFSPGTNHVVFIYDNIHYFPTPAFERVAECTDRVAPFSKEDFFKMLEKSHIEEWKRNYNNPKFLDGGQWSIDIEFADGSKPLHYSGSNAYPYGYKEIADFFGESNENINECFK